LCTAAVQPLLPPASASLDAAEECIDFIGTAILMIDVREWEQQETLKDFVARTLGTSSTETEKYRLPLSFNAKTFKKVAGIHIAWERDLLKHLEIGLNDRSLAIFHNIQVLSMFEQSSFSSIFPPRFLDETRRTVWLVLLIADNDCRKWFDADYCRLGLGVGPDDITHLRAPQRNIQNFDFWRDRLIVAKDAFDTSQPSGLIQFWRDDRNRVQWWTFWIAIVVFLLTLVGVVESALQMYKVYYPAK